MKEIREPMTKICLFVGTDQSTSAFDRETILTSCSFYSELKLITTSWHSVTDDVIKHAPLLILLDKPENVLQLKVIGERNKLNFDRTLDLASSDEPNTRTFDTNTITKWLAQQLARPEKQVRDIDHLVGTWKSDLLSHLKTDHFQDQTCQFGNYAEQLAQARNNGKQAVLAAYRSFSDINEQELSTIVDIYLSLRSVKCYQEMAELYISLHPVLQELDLLKEQYVFAKNRLAINTEEKEKLVDILKTITQPSSETLAIMGRIYKDCWSFAEPEEKQHYLDQTISSYQQASYLDTRDTYPAINYATFLRIRSNEGDLTEMRAVLDCLLYNLKVSTTVFDNETPAGTCHSHKRAHDYWDVATALEVYVLRQHQDKVWGLTEALISQCSENWMLETTLNNLKIINSHVNSAPLWLGELINALTGELAHKEKS